MEERLKKLNDQSNKDDILCFEQLGIDMMFIDEADIFKNLFIYSKMTNVSGISQPIHKELPTYLPKHNISMRLQIIEVLSLRQEHLFLTVWLSFIQCSVIFNMIY
mgnify:CR=1 FL=1